MELLNLIIIIPVREVFLLEILLELFPLQFPFTDLLYLLEVFPPNGCSSILIKYGKSCLHVSWIILYLIVLLYPKNPSFSFLSRLYLTIICKRFSFPKFILRAIPMVFSSSPFMRRWTCISTGFFIIRWSTRSPSSSHSAALTAFSPRVYMPLQICQTLQHGRIQMMLLFLGFNQDSHGGCNI